MNDSHVRPSPQALALLSLCTICRASSILPRIIDHNDVDIDTLPGEDMQALAAGCRAAATERLGRAADELVPLRSRLGSRYNKNRLAIPHFFSQI